jgi:proteasome lid subunit RPN8/RPN11
MLRALVSTASQMLGDLHRTLFRSSPASTPRRVLPVPAAAHYAPLQRLVLTDGVGRTLFEQFAGHRQHHNGEAETGWVLLGLREASEAVALATLPAGARADAGVAHVRFNSEAQALGSRIIRQEDKRLTILGVVHTHPGTLRHPSDGDFRGDSQWVRNLRGREGVFAIGTADAVPQDNPLIAYQPRPHVQCWGELRFTWYSLRQGEKTYRPLAVELTHGPDLAHDLHRVWSILEAHAERLERLLRQQAGMHFEVLPGGGGGPPGLLCTLPLAGPGESLRILVREKEVRYFLIQGGELLEVEQNDSCIDRGVYLLLAELAAPVGGSGSAL